MKAQLASTAVLLSALTTACLGGNDAGGSCVEGAETCPCYGNGTCDAGLACRSGLCVSDFDAGTSTAGGGGGPSGGGFPSTSGDDDDDGGRGGETGGPGGDGPAGETSDGGSDGDDDPTTAGGEPGGPVIVSLITNTDVVGGGDTVVISAIVTDPDGIQDVIGGQLQTSDGSSIYGTFATTADEGAYTTTLRWSDFLDMEPADLELSPIERSVRAVFFDQSGATGWETLTFSLECSADLFCGDRCLDVDCYPGVLPCDDGFSCQGGICVAAGTGQYGDPCKSESDCVSVCGPADVFPDGACSGDLCCAGPFCEPGSEDCGGGTCIPMFAEEGAPGCPVEPVGVCL